MVGGLPLGRKAQEMDNLSVLCALRQSCVMLTPDTPLTEALEVGKSAGPIHSNELASYPALPVLPTSLGLYRIYETYGLTFRAKVEWCGFQVMDEAEETVALVLDADGALIGVLTKASVVEAIAASKTASATSIPQ